MGQVNLKAITLKIGGVRETQQIFQMILPEVFIAPVGNLHLSVRPLPPVFADEVFQILLLIPPDNGFFRDCPDHPDTFIRPGTADAIISDKQAMGDSLSSDISHHCLKRLAVPMNIRYNRVFHPSSGFRSICRPMPDRGGRINQPCMKYNGYGIPFQTGRRLYLFRNVFGNQSRRFPVCIQRTLAKHIASSSLSYGG